MKSANVNIRGMYGLEITWSESRLRAVPYTPGRTLWASTVAIEKFTGDDLQLKYLALHFIHSIAKDAYSATDVSFQRIGLSFLTLDATCVAEVIGDAISDNPTPKPA
jgi:hypothetical protein